MAAVPQHHQERLIDVRETVPDELLDVQVRMPFEFGRNLRRDERGELSRRPRRGADEAIGEPEEEDSLREQQDREKRDEAEGYAPVEAAIPDWIRHQETSANL